MTQNKISRFGQGIFDAHARKKTVFISHCLKSKRKFCNNLFANSKQEGVEREEGDCIAFERGALSLLLFVAWHLAGVFASPTV